MVEVLMKGMKPLFRLNWEAQLQNRVRRKMEFWLSPSSMQKTALAILLIGFTAVAQAEWTKVGTSNLDTDVYFDADTRRKEGNTAQMWVLFDLANPRQTARGAIRSFKSLNEFNCNDGKFSSISRVFYSGPMGTGNVVDSYDDTHSWISVIPGSGMEVISHHACGKK
jgi:hypothetical protein